MQKHYSKGLKSKLIKQIALFMSLCYLFGPLQPQFSSILHEISHRLELPRSVLAHPSDENVAEIHAQHEHNNSFSEHSHPLIDLVDTIFENENEESNKSPVSKVKLKKHVTAETLVLPIGFNEQIDNCFFKFKEQLHSGYLATIDAPPKTALL